MESAMRALCNVLQSLLHVLYRNHPERMYLEIPLPCVHVSMSLAWRNPGMLIDKVNFMTLMPISLGFIAHNPDRVDVTRTHNWFKHAYISGEVLHNDVKKPFVFMCCNNILGAKTIFLSENVSGRRNFTLKMACQWQTSPFCFWNKWLLGM